MSTSIGQGRPSAGVLGGGIDAPRLIEALSRHVSPQRIDEVLARTRRVERRRRKLPAASIVWLVVMMGLRADLDMLSLWRQVCGVLASMLATLGGVVRPIAKSALSRARKRLRARPLRQLVQATGQASRTAGGAVYRGMRLVAMDGDSYKLPDTPANVKAFGRPSTARPGCGDDGDKKRDRKNAEKSAKKGAGKNDKKGRKKGGKKSGKAVKLEGGYPQLHLTRLIDVGTRVTIDAIVKPNATNDRAAAPRLLSAAAENDLVLWDCGFYSFAAMARAMATGRHFLGPAPAHAILAPLRRLADGSYLAKAYSSPNDRRDDRGGIVVRVIEYTLDDPARVGCGERHRLVTDLLDAKAYPARELIVLYHQRWEIEIANDEITTHQLDRAVELRSKTPGGAVQEVYGILLAHNAVRLIMAEAAATATTTDAATGAGAATGARVEVDPRTLSFTHAIRVIRETVQEMRNAPVDRLPMLYQAMLAAVLLGRLPPRDGRINPRVVKVIRPSNFPVKKPKHRNWPQPRGPFTQSIVMLK